ncbi:MAG: glycosyltransferase family A protein [Candidatus Nanopelagicaceae bacterium]|nr:glycosyltransferase family A protein [Candidatus Nanopelagicaceae bacterium]
MKPKVSVIIPIFNKANWIEETLLSVRDQSFQDWECILVDDGSSDESLKRINAFIAINPGKWILISQNNAGQCVARNRGIQEATGEYIALLDGDDTWAPNKLEVQVKIMDENEDASLVICPYRIYKPEQKQVRGRIVYHQNAQKMLKNWFNLRGFGGGTESTGLIRRSVLDSVGVFDPHLSTSAGLDLSMRLGSQGKILSADSTFMKYKIHTGQWHSNLQILASDLHLLREKHSEAFGAKGIHLEDQHLAYLHLHDLREGISVEKLSAVMRKPRSLFYLVILVFSIVRRNFVARVRAKYPNVLTKIPRKYHQFLFS